MPKPFSRELKLGGIKVANSPNSLAVRIVKEMPNCCLCLPVLLLLGCVEFCDFLPLISHLSRVFLLLLQGN